MHAQKHDHFNDRMTASANARKAALERFRARPPADDPAVIARQMEQKAIAEAREARIAEREAARAAEAARKAEEEKAAAIALAAAQAEEAARATALLAKQKADRDARYAARKARR